MENEIEEYKNLVFERYKIGDKLCASARTKRERLPHARYSFFTQEKREEWINEEKEKHDEHEKRKIEYREERKQPHGLSVGDILSASWGYDQTNVDFFQVVAVRGKMVDVRAIKASVKDTGFMCGDATPIPNQFIENEKILSRRPSVYQGVAHVKIHESATATKWDGKPEGCSWYA